MSMIASAYDRWFSLPALLRWGLLLALFAATCALTYALDWGTLPATPFYPVVLLSVALGTERQGYVLAALSVAASIGLAWALHVPHAQQEESMDSAVLALVAGAMIVAMHQRRHSTRLMKQVTYETGVIRALGNYALTRLTLEEMMRAIVRYLANSTDSDSALVALVDHTGERLLGYVDDNGHGIGPQPVERAIEGTLTGAVYQSGKPKLVPDTALEPTYVQAAPVPIRSAVCVPLLLAGHPIGVLMVGKRATDAYSKDDVRLLETLARTVAVPLYARRPSAVAARTAQNETRETREGPRDARIS